MSLTALCVLILIVMLAWGAFGYQRVGTAPWVGPWSPFGFVLLVLLVLFLTGNLHLTPIR